MKKIFLIITSVLMIFVLAACESKNAQSSATKPNNADISEDDSENSDEPSSSSENSYEASEKKVLVVYYSATGNTQEAAEYIASATKGDLFELIPVKPYSSADLNWNDKNSRVVYEHENPGERKVELVAATVNNFDEYDVVFIGYPIWWGIAAWPVDSFIEANDFTGKTVIPFCTSASSGLGESGELLKEAAGSGTWLEGIRFSSGVSETEVKEWVNNLKY